jgi:phage shock protein C
VTDRLYRSPNDRVIAGVAGGLATWMNLDPSIVRVAWVLLGILSGGLFVLVYIVMMIVVPLPPPGWTPMARGTGAPGGWPGAGQAGGGWTGGTSAGSPAPGAVPGLQAPEGTTWAPPPTGQAPADAIGTSWNTPQPAWTPPTRNIDTGTAGIVFGAVLVLLGAWFLVDQYVDVDWDLLWPVVVIVLGVGLIAVAWRRGRPAG